MRRVSCQAGDILDDLPELIIESIPYLIYGMEVLDVGLHLGGYSLADLSELEDFVMAWGLSLLPLLP